MQLSLYRTVARLRSLFECLREAPEYRRARGVRHSLASVLGQTRPDSAGGEITGARRLLDELGCAGYTVTLDALHSCPHTAAAFTTTDVAHGRIETRTCALLNLDTTPDEYADLPGRRQAFRITRERTVQRTGKHTVETTYGLTSLTPACAGPAAEPEHDRPAPDARTAGRRPSLP